MRKKRRAAKAKIESESIADVVRGMADHFSRTGEYRAEDISRVLGDPVGGVIFEPAPTAEMAYRQAAGR